MNKPKSNKTKAVFFDIDGTLLLLGKGPFREDLDAMEEAVRKGNFLFLNSGRSFSNIPDNILELPFWSGIAAGGGAHVLMKDNTALNNKGEINKPSPQISRSMYKTIYHKWVDKQLLEDITVFYLGHSKSIVLEGEKDCYAITPSDLYYTADFAKAITDKNDFSNLYPDDFITKLTIEGSVSKEERGLLEDFFTINSFHDYTEAVIKGENKGRAMEIILDTMGIKQENSIAIGDGINDIDMFKFAGLGIAMGNANDEVKAAAGEITGNCGKGGAALALKRFVLG